MHACRYATHQASKPASTRHSLAGLSMSPLLSLLHCLTHLCFPLHTTRSACLLEGMKPIAILSSPHYFLTQTAPCQVLKLSSAPL